MIYFNMVYYNMTYYTVIYYDLHPLFQRADLGDASSPRRA